MKQLDDILFGFLIFFMIDKFIKLLGSAFIEPWIEKRTDDRQVIETWKLAVELGFLFVASCIVYFYRKSLAVLVA